MDQQTKPCSQCDIEKPLDCYYTKHGVPYPNCKDCHKAAVKRSQERRKARAAAPAPEPDEQPEIETRPLPPQTVLHRNGLRWCCGSAGCMP